MCQLETPFRLSFSGWHKKDEFRDITVQLSPRKWALHRPPGTCAIPGRKHIYERGRAKAKTRYLYVSRGKTTSWGVQAFMVHVPVLKRTGRCTNESPFSGHDFKIAGEISWQNWPGQKSGPAKNLFVRFNRDSTFAQKRSTLMDHESFMGFLRVPVLGLRDDFEGRDQTTKLTAAWIRLWSRKGTRKRERERERRIEKVAFTLIRSDWSFLGRPIQATRA